MSQENSFGFAEVKENELPPWEILIVDDEEDIHAVTRLALKGHRFLNRELKFTNAYSVKEAKAKLEANPTFALVLLDVVMESPKAGLELVSFLRSELHNPFTRIVLRTGQPDEAPELEVIVSYQIDDYRLKTELTQDKLKALVTTALRSYDAMMQVEIFRQSLEKKVQKRTAKIQKQNQELEKLNNLKTKIFTILAHDLRNPLATLQSLLQLAQRQVMEPESMKNIMQTLTNNLGNTSDMLEQLLSWANSQLEGFQFNPIHTKAIDWLHYQVSLQQSLADNKQIQLRLLDCPEDLLLYIDLDLMNTVLRNLIQNAIKFTAEGGQISVYVEVEDLIRIVVQDTGIGMNAEKIRQLENNQIISSRGTQGEKGTGLGLLMCKDFIALHKGFISVESEPGKGTSFSIYLPQSPEF